MKELKSKAENTIQMNKNIFIFIPFMAKPLPHQNKSFLSIARYFYVWKYAKNDLENFVFNFYTHIKIF